MGAEERKHRTKIFGLNIIHPWVLQHGEYIVRMNKIYNQRHCERSEAECGNLLPRDDTKGSSLVASAKSQSAQIGILSGEGGSIVFALL